MDAGYISTADDLLDASYELLTGASQTPGESFTVRGTILPMSGESLDFYHQVVGYDDWTAEEQQMFLPLVLKADYLGSMDNPVPGCSRQARAWRCLRRSGCWRVR